MTRWLRRLGTGVFFGLPMALSAFAFGQAPAQAQGGEPPAVECASCHPAFQEAWESGAHGQATTDPVFMQSWRDQGKPDTCLPCHTTGYDPETGMWQADGITCRACHGTEAGDHPEGVMTAHRSADLCGKCHSETYFEWQVSGHRMKEMVCVDCHDPHTASLKAFDSSVLCSNCHQTRGSEFAHTAHSEQGLTCADCHLTPTEGTPQKGHATRDHSFRVKLETCNPCHEYQLHGQEAILPSSQPTPDESAMASGAVQALNLEPSPISPVGFAMLSGLIGMASGMILSPWLERWYHRIRQDDEWEKRDE